MQTAANRNRILTGCSSKVGLADSEILVNRSGLLQHIVASHFAQTAHSQEVFVKLTNELIHHAEQAYVMRDAEALGEVSQVLMNLPVDAARQIGLYYHALAINRKGHREEAEGLLERVYNDAPLTYRARALQTLGANHHDKGLLDEALKFQLEVLRVTSAENVHGLQPTLMAGFEISTIKSLDGNHRGALSSLRGLGALVNLVARQQPFYFYLYCSELAIELGELDQVAEAEAALDIALTSPYAPAYPNWAETRQELEAKRTSATPSVVAVNQTSEVIPTPQTQPQPCRKPNRVVAFRWLRIKRTSIQTAVIAIARFRAIACSRSNRNTLERLGRCIRSRAPPTQH
jgi:tetratricopeptide (TPR) repeat protein